MARKSVEFSVIFHYPEGEKGKLLLSNTLGEVHTKLIIEVLDKRISDVEKKNRIIKEVHKNVG